jgi:lipoprotein-anchoring transpeptidase ErfK/SrfK
MSDSDWPITLASHKPQKGKHIDINISTQTLKLYKNGKAVGSYKISSGKRSMPTPKGTFQVYNKARRSRSAEYKLFMPYWMAFKPDGSHGIHELPEWPNGAKEGARHLGVPVSHGCVRLGIGAARAVYDWAPIGTTVIIH